VLRYRFEFVGNGSLPRPDNVYREAPILVGTVERYIAERYLVESVDEETLPAVAVLRRLRD
jgi:hypothetical protein